MATDLVSISSGSSTRLKDADDHICFSYDIRFRLLLMRIDGLPCKQGQKVSSIVTWGRRSTCEHDCDLRENLQRSSGRSTMENLHIQENRYYLYATRKGIVKKTLLEPLSIVVSISRSIGD